MMSEKESTQCLHYLSAVNKSHIRDVSSTRFGLVNNRNLYYILECFAVDYWLCSLLFTFVITVLFCTYIFSHDEQIMWYCNVRFFCLIPNIVIISKFLDFKVN